jgi:transmembrane sensor
MALMRDPTRELPTSETVDDAASLWFARCDAGLSAAEQIKFEQWLARDPRHATVWREFQEALDVLPDRGGDALARAMNHELARRQQRRKQFRLAKVFTGTLAAAAAVALMFSPAHNDSVTALEASAGEPAAVVISTPESQNLPDGSTVELNRGASIEIDFTAGQRRVHLVRGEGYFNVAKDPLRPFVVEVHGVRVKAIGTAFSVGVGSDRVDVLVTQGQVAVARAPDHPTSPPTERVIAGAGTRVLVPIQNHREPVQVENVPAAESDHHLAWRGPRLDLSATPLAAAFEAFNRQGGIELRIGDRILGDLRLSGMFRIDNAEGFARMLELNYEMRAERVGNTITLYRSR